MDATDEIKSRLSIEEVVSAYVSLKKHGRNLQGLCPFHKDTKPSLMVSSEKGLAWCFSCQSGGDMFKFIELVEGVSFPEALKILADKASVVLPAYNKKTSDIQKNKNKRLEECLEVVSEFYIQEFKKNNQVQQYWETRKINKETTQVFCVGYAPDSFTKTMDYLKKKGFTLEEIEDAGLAVSKDTQKGEFFDRFRKRIMIPIYDQLGYIKGFGGRIIDNAKDAAKYLNSPETSLYHKSQILFGLSFAKQSIKHNNAIVILEGYMDVIASYQAGVQNIVAVSGTALTDEQLKLIRRYTKNIKLCFDQDPAGREATKRSIELALKYDFSIEVVMIQGAKDCDELIKTSKEAWQKSIDESISSFDFLCVYAEEKYNIKNEESQKQFIYSLFSSIIMYSSTILQQGFIKTLSEKCSIDNKLLLEEFLRFQKSSQKNKRQDSLMSLFSKNALGESYSITQGEYLLGIIFSYPQYIPILKKELILQIFQDSKTKDIYKQLIDHYNESDDLDGQSFSFDFFSNEIKDSLKIWSLYTEKNNDHMTEKEWIQEVHWVIQKMNIKNINIEEKKVLMKINQSKDKQEQETLLLKIIELSKLKKKI